MDKSQEISLSSKYSFKHKIVLQKLLSEELLLIDKLKREMLRYPKGKLSIRKKTGYVYYYIVNGSDEKAVHKNDKLLHLMARKTMINNELKARKVNCEILNDALQRISVPIFNKSTEKQFLRLKEIDNSEQILLSNEEYSWKTTCNVNQYHSENLIYKTSSGTMVRSKSERIIANALDKYQVIYIYEPAFCIGGKTIYPDFVILCKDGTIIIWEHFGLMDDETYHNKAMTKISDYRKCGFIQCKNLICTYEEDLQDETLIYDIIERFIL